MSYQPVERSCERDTRKLQTPFEIPTVKTESSGLSPVLDIWFARDDFWINWESK